MAQPPLIDAVIVSYGPQPPDSGMIAFHRSVTLQRSEGGLVILWMAWATDGLYFDDYGDAPLAKIGSVCTVRYSSDVRIETSDRPVDLVDHMDCRSPTGEPAETEPVVFETATIIAYSPAPSMPQFTMHRSVTARQRSGSALDLEFLWTSKSRALSGEGEITLPPVGAVCDITYRIRRVAEPLLHTEAMVDRIDCR